MKKTITTIFVILFSLTAFSLGVELDLNTSTGNQPLDVNLSARILEGIQTRDCWDNNDCGTEINKPSVILGCGPCTNGSTISCTTAQFCPGIQTCAAEIWGACVDDPTDDCPISTDPVIIVEEIFPKEDITVTQNIPFTFQTKVTCLNADCGNVEATLDPQISLTIELDADDASVCGNSFMLSVFGYLGNSSGASCSTGLKFNDVLISQGSIINAASVELVSRGNHSNNATNLIIQSQTDDNPLIFSNLTEFNSRTRSTAFVEWNNVPAFTALQTYNTPDLTPIIQEIINQTNWQEGDSIVIFLADNESTSDALRLAIDSSDEYYGTENEAKLNITYTPNPTIKGVIPMNTGNPFYTTDNNPQNSINTACLSNMLAGETCTNTWSVMPTGNIGGTFKFFVDYVPTNLLITQKRTKELFISIEAGESCVDNDGDLVQGFNPLTCYSGLDCDDTRNDINPAQPELCNGIDDNCNGETDEGCPICVENWECNGWSACETGIPPFVFEWDFGDGTSETKNSPNWVVHTYSSGIFNPKIKVTDVLNNLAEDEKTIAVALSNGNFKPIAKANGEYIAGIGENINLSSAGSSDDISISQYEWKIINTKGNPCIPSTIIEQNPVIVCNEAGTAEATLTVTDNQGATDSDTAVIKVNQTQTQDLVNIVKMKLQPDIVKQGQDLTIIVRVENQTNKTQNFDIKFEVKENKANENISNLPNLISDLELLNQQILPYSQGEGRKEFVLVIPAAELETELDGQKNYWVYASVKATGENNILLNSRRIAFSYSGTGTKQVKVPEINFLNTLIILITIMIILTKRK